MAKTRTFTPKGHSPPKVRHPQTVTGWTALVDRAIERAAETSDRRLAGLQKARGNGTTETYLRSLGIICEADILREFPDPTAKS